MLEIVSGRNNPSIDPHLEIWGWPVAAYLFLGGLTAGLMILQGIFRLRNEEAKASFKMGSLLAPLLLSLGMFFLWLDLSYKAHVFRFYMTFQILSPMSWGAWILILVYPAAILGMALPGGWESWGKPISFVNPIWEWVKRLAGKHARAVAIANIIMGLLLGIYTGVLLSAFAARPLWNSALLPILFVVSGLSTAAALNMSMKPAEIEFNRLLKWDIALITAELSVLLLIIISFLTGGEAQQEAVKLLLGGAYTPSFWIFVVILGLSMPFWLEVRESRHLPVPGWAAPVLILVGGLALRLVLVYAGQASYIPDTEMLSGFSGH